MKKTIVFFVLVLSLFAFLSCDGNDDSSQSGATGTTPAKTKLDSIVVTFNANGGVIATESMEMLVDYETELKRASKLGMSYDNHVFKGWGLSNSDTSPLYKDGQKVKFSVDTTLYAVWEEIIIHNKPTVQYSFNDGQKWKGSTVCWEPYYDITMSDEDGDLSSYIYNGQTYYIKGYQYSTRIYYGTECMYYQAVKVIKSSWKPYIKVYDEKGNSN